MFLVSPLSALRMTGPRSTKEGPLAQAWKVRKALQERVKYEVNPKGLIVVD